MDKDSTGREGELILEHSERGGHGARGNSPWQQAQTQFPAFTIAGETLASGLTYAPCSVRLCPGVTSADRSQPFLFLLLPKETKGEPGEGRSS